MSGRPRLLDLFSGAGGCSVGYHRAGFDVVGVDLEPQPDYPYEFINADAVALLESGSNFFAKFDAVHASPPCQSFTAYRRRGDGVGDGYPDLIAPVRRLLVDLGLPYVIENVAGAPLENPVQLCGSSFGLDVRRHRLFESNIDISAPPCDHGWQTPRFPPATNRTNLRRTVEVGVWRIPLATQQSAMGIDWMPLRSLTEAIPPAYTEHIGTQLLAHIESESAAMSACADDCMHPGRTCRPINCPDCGRLSAHSWSWDGYSQDGYFSEWGGTCSLHGHWRDGS